MVLAGNLHARGAHRKPCPVQPEQRKCSQSLSRVRSGAGAHMWGPPRPAAVLLGANMPARSANAQPSRCRTLAQAAPQSHADEVTNAACRSGVVPQRDSRLQQLALHLVCCIMVQRGQCRTDVADLCLETRCSSFLGLSPPFEKPRLSELADGRHRAGKLKHT